jgi:cyclophilin family peptidyl-prolyl cis-trans isomerase
MPRLTAAPAALALLAVPLALAQGPSIEIGKLFHPPGQPVIALVKGASADQEFDLLLLDATGTVTERATARGDEHVDLAAALPALGSMEDVRWLQLAKGEVPIGCPWVVQPLVGRPAVRTAPALRPDGKTPYTRIIGWGDELLEPDNPEHQRLKSLWPAGEPIVRSGLRIYPDRDVRLRTEAGDIRVALAPDQAPNTAWNFRELAAGGLYDGTVFHRVVKFDREGRPFVIQGGDPTGTGDGGPGYDLPFERSRLAHDFGVISMARGDQPDTAGSQFFFGLSREGTARLDTQYGAFGWAVEGGDAILRISDVEIADLATGRPKQPVKVISAELVPAPPRVPGRGRPDGRVTASGAAPQASGPDR